MSLDYGGQTIAFSEYNFEEDQSDQNHDRGWPQGVIEVSFQDYRYFFKKLKNRSTDEEGRVLDLEGRNKSFNICRKFKIEANFFSKEDYLMCVIYPLKIIKAMDMVTSHFRVADIRKLGALGYYSKHNFMSKKCILTRRMKSCVAVPPLSWLCKVKIHTAYTSSNKYALFKDSWDFYQHKFESDIFHPSMPKDLLFQLLMMEQSCFRHLTKFQDFKCQILDRKMTDCLIFPAKAHSVNICPGLSPTFNQKVSDIIFKETKTFLIYPSSPLGVILTQNKISLERLFSEKEMRQLASRYNIDIIELACKSFKSGQIARFRPKICSEFWTYAHWWKVALGIDLNALFRDNRRLKILYFIPKWENDILEKVVCNIDFEKYLQLCQFI